MNSQKILTMALRIPIIILPSTLSRLPRFFDLYGSRRRSAIIHDSKPVLNFHSMLEMFASLPIMVNRWLVIVLKFKIKVSE
jgi:hypothetical protein